MRFTAEKKTALGIAALADCRTMQSVSVTRLIMLYRAVPVGITAHLGSHLDIRYASEHGSVCFQYQSVTDGDSIG